MSKKQVKDVPYTIIPIAPKDFDGAVAAHREAVAALQYWKDMKRYASWTEEHKKAQSMLPKWQVVKDNAHQVIQSYQLKLF